MTRSTVGGESPCVSRDLARRLAGLGVGERQDAVAQRLVSRRQAVQARGGRSPAASVVPLTNSVNSTKPVASTATKRWISCGSAAFSVTASAKTRVSAPRRPPQMIASLYEASMRWVSPKRSSGGTSTNSAKTRAPNAAAISTASKSTSRNPISTSSRGTRIEASTKISERAQNAICSHRSARNDQFSGAIRDGPRALTVRPDTRPQPRPIRGTGVRRR